MQAMELAGRRRQRSDAGGLEVNVSGNAAIKKGAFPIVKMHPVVCVYVDAAFTSGRKLVFDS